VILRAIALLTVVSLLALPAPLQAQAYSRKLTAAEAEELVLSRSFEGINVSAAVRDSARRLIRSANDEFGRIDFSEYDWKDRRLDLMRRRTAQIRALLKAPGDVDRYDRNTRVYLTP
jgi:hypothetical protein